MANDRRADVIRLFRPGAQIDDEPEVSIGLPPIAAPTPKGTAQKARDLAGKSKVWFLIGPGGSGKTMLARWLGWKMETEGREAVIAALDPQNRSLATWFSGTYQPPTSDGAQTARWLRDLLGFLMDRKQSAILDFGGGDTALAKLIDTTSDVTETMEAAGVEPVACYTLGPRVDDLASLGSLGAVGFLPKSTLLVLNEGRVDSTLSREEAFARVMRHSTFVKAVERGAYLAWMPRLEPEVAQEIEGKRLTFGHARDGKVPAGQTYAPVGGLKRSMVGRWLDRMEHAFAPIASWRP